MAKKQQTPTSNDLTRDLSNGWQRVRFDEIADNITDRIDVPSESGLDRFVGGDHLDSGSLKIRRWGSTSDVEAQKLLFKKGHILFGKRNAYLRKVAYADFDGVCSAHMLVLKAKPPYVLDEFFPFFMQTDQFWERAIMISEGSMSPTIKWKTLARQEFALPPLDEQRRIAEILWAADEALVAAEGVHAASKLALVRGCQELTSGPNAISRHGWRTLALSECADILDNRRKPLSQSERATMQGSIPYFGANGQIDSINDFMFDEEIVLLGEDGDHFFKFQDWPQSFLVNGKSWVNNHAHVFRAREHCTNRWLYWFFQHRDITSFLQDSASMSRRKLTKATLMTLPVTLPSHADQDRIINVLDGLDKVNCDAGSHVEKCKALRRQVLEALIPMP